MTQAKKQDDTRLNLASQDAVGERIEQLKALLPEIFVEGQLDPERLRQHLGDFSKVGAERYGLNWAGKADAIRSLQIPSHGTLVPMKDQSVNFDESENMIIEGDNLEVLKLLQKSYHGKIKMIYIDPPYNTGGDFIYPDNFKEGLDTYLRYSGQTTESGFKVSTNSENGGRYHSNWLNMMYPRLFMAKTLLKNDGAIFVSIDDTEVANLRLMMNEVFGEENFVGVFIWNAGRKNDSKQISVSHEYVVVYTKSLSYLNENNILWREQKNGVDRIVATYKKLAKQYPGDWAKVSQELQAWYKALKADDPALENKHYRCADERGVYFPSDLSGPDDGRKSRPRYEVLHPVTKKPVPVPARGWRWEKPRMDQALAENRVHFGADETSIPNGKVYIEENDTQAPSSVFYQDRRKASGYLEKLLGEKVFDFPKDTDVLQRFVQLVANDKDDIILDFFAGSGSTAEAVINANERDRGSRKFILVQLPENITEDTKAYNAGFRNIAEICRKRVVRVIENLSTKEAENLPLEQRTEPLGFKAFKLSSSNFKLWDASAGSKDADGLAKQLELYADNLLPGRSQDDILYEVILKAGQPLTAKIEKIEIAGQQVFSIGGAMLICLEDPIKEETLVGMLEYQPAIIVALDKAFHGNDQLKTNIKLQAEATGESEQSRVLFKTV